MSVEQLQTFVAVAETGKLSLAAVRLNITEPPLSRRLSALEAELKSPLFVRKARGMDLTQTGERLLPHARSVLSALAKLRRIAEVSRVEDPPVGADAGSVLMDAPLSGDGV